MSQPLSGRLANLDDRNVAQQQGGTAWALTKYADKWVAVSAGNIVATANSREALLRNPKVRHAVPARAVLGDTIYHVTREDTA